MKKVIPKQYVSDNESFEPKFYGGYSTEYLHSILYISPYPDDEYVYDYDGIKEWYYSWNKDDELFHDTSFEEYIDYHLDRTVFSVSVPSEIWKKY